MKRLKKAPATPVTTTQPEAGGKHRLRKFGMAWMVLSLMVSIFALAPGAEAEASSSICADLTVRGDRIQGGSSNCYYVVMDTTDWSRLCAGRGGVSCGNADNGVHRVDAYDRSNWQKVESYNLTVTAGAPSTCARLTEGNGFLGGGSSFCYYVILDTSDWSRVCAGNGGDGTIGGGCGPLDGSYKIDMYNRAWQRTSYRATFG